MPYREDPRAKGQGPIEKLFSSILLKFEEKEPSTNVLSLKYKLYRKQKPLVILYNHFNWF